MRAKDMPKFMLRMEPELKEQLEVMAKANRRSLNSELVMRLERSLTEGKNREEQAHANAPA